MLQLQSGTLNLNEGNGCVMTSTNVDHRQVLWMKKLLKKSTCLLQVIDDRQLISSMNLLASLLVAYIWSWWRLCWWKRCLHDGCHKSFLTFRRKSSWHINEFPPFAQQTFQQLYFTIFICGCVLILAL